MIRTLAAATAFAALVTLSMAGAASAQTWGQPLYLNAYGRPVGGAALSEVETRSHVQTGRWADGYSDRPHVYVPAPAYSPHGYSQGYRGHGLRRGYRSGYDGRRGRYDPPARPGYRDEWGYQDDRPPPAGRWTEDRRSRRDARDCGCGDVYPYDR